MEKNISMSAHNLSSSISSPFSPRSKLNKSKRTSLLPALKKSSRFSVSGKSIQSVQIITKTPYHTVELFGASLHVLITEALTFVDRNIIVSAQIADCGYAWVVCGRRLLVWQYKQLSNSIGNTSQCYELILPQSDLVHRADLVCIIASDSNINTSSPACLAVSPEGIVRYWPSLSHEGVYVEESIELHGQECDSVIHVPNIGCILATTTCSVVLLVPSRQSIVSRTLKPPAGWLGGISRRISSFVFGPLSTSQTSETRLIKLLSSNESGEWCIYVLAGQTLQKWSLETAQGSEQLKYECDIGRMVREAFHNALWHATAGGDSAIDTDIWLLDMHIYNGCDLILLAAAVNIQRSPQVHYAAVSLYVKSGEASVDLNWLTILKVNGMYRQDAESEVFGYRLLVCSNQYYVYNRRSVIALGNVTKQHLVLEEPDVIEFVNAGDCILGGSVCINTPLFFSKNHGLLTITNNNEFNAQEQLNSSIAASDGAATPSHMGDISICDSNIGNLTLYDLDPQEIVSVETNSVGQLKSAFIYFVRRDTGNCHSYLNELFPMTGAVQIDATLDRTVIKVSEDLLNDIPAVDPRWLEHNTRPSLGSSSSLQISRQILDKQKVFNLFISFLKEMRLWERLSQVNVNNVITATSYVLAEHAEKIITAITLRNIQNEHESLLLIAMKASIQNDDQSMDANLSVQDLFYRNLTQVHRLIQNLTNICLEQSHSELAPLQLANMIRETNSIILTILQEVITFRQNNVETFISATSNQCEYLPWTAAMGQRGLYDALNKMQKLTLEEGVNIITADANFLDTLYEQLVSLIDLILDGRKCHLESVRGTEKFNVLYQQYETIRHQLIQPIYENKQYERASILAEKYLDFGILISICEATDNQEKLNEYIERFESDQFSEYLFKWCLRENRPNRLIYRKGHSRVGQKQNASLAKLVSDCPSISWLQNIHQGDMNAACNVLCHLADEEQKYVTRKKTMLSIAKLAQLAAINTNQEIVSQIDSELNLIAHQEDIPDTVISEHGYNSENPPVLSPSELILLYIDLENSSITELDFKKALDLLEYVSDELERSDLTHKIWCTAILKDSTLWQKLMLEPNVHAVIDTTFFKLIDLSKLMGADINQFLPPLERLLEAPELHTLNRDTNFQFLMKSGYEYVQQNGDDSPNEN